MRDTPGPDASPTRPGGGRLRRLLGEASTAELLLWAAVLAALVADVYSTYWGLKLGLAEWNPVMRWAVEALGFPSLAASKVIVVGLGGAVRSAEVVWAPAVPLGIGLPWTVAALLNLLVIL
jgi:hypothetical protein